MTTESRYTDELVSQALADAKRMSLADAARKHGIPLGTLGTWRRQGGRHSRKGVSRYRPDKRAEIIAYAQQFGISTTSEQFGVGRTTLKRWCAGMTLPKRSNPVAKPSELRARAVARAKEVGPGRAALELGLNRGTVASWVNRAYSGPRKRKPADETGGRYLHGKEVVDAEHELRVFIEPEDIAAAVPWDPRECAFAQACKRAYKSGEALFMREVAYIELPTDNGVRRIERFNIPRPVRRQIDRFDATRETDEGGYLLKPPPPCDRLDIKRGRQMAKRHQRKAILKGDLASSASPPQIQPPRREPVADIRRGIGMAQFSEHRS